MRIRQLSLFVLCFMFLGEGVVHGAAGNQRQKVQRESPDESSVSRAEVGKWRSASRKLTPLYERFVRDIRLGKEDVSARMTTLRSYYSFTPYYDPFSKDLIDEMTGYAYIVDTSEDRAEVNSALSKYRDLVYRHVAHLGVVSYALTLSRVDVRFGDEAFLRKVRDSIRNIWSGMPAAGLSPDNPYPIITYAEEEYLLQTYGATVEKSEIYPVGRKFYDVRDIVTEGGQSVQLFFDVTTPIRTVNIWQEYRKKEEKVTIPLQ